MLSYKRSRRLYFNVPMWFLMRFNVALIGSSRQKRFGTAWIKNYFLVRIAGVSESPRIILLVPNFPGTSHRATPRLFGIKSIVFRSAAFIRGKVAKWRHLDFGEDWRDLPFVRAVKVSTSMRKTEKHPQRQPEKRILLRALPYYLLATAWSDLIRST